MHCKGYRFKCASPAYLRKCDLRFYEPELELRFKKSLEDRLIRSIVGMSLVFVVRWLSYAVGARDELTHVDGHAKRLQFAWVSLVSMVFPSVALLLSGLMHCIRSCRSLNLKLHWEIVAVFLSFPFSVLLPWVHGWSLAKVNGWNPDEVWLQDSRGTEGSACLMLDAITTIVCLFVPIRIHFKLISPICSCMSFSCSVFILGSPFSHSVSQRIFALWVLTFCALWGAWHIERDSRRSWIAHAQVESKSKEVMQYHVGLSRIMDRLSDSLVCLDNEFAILERNPRLAALLLHQGSDGLKGATLLDYMVPEDRERFVRALQASRGSVEPGRESEIPGGMLHINLRDSCNREFCVYAYYAGVCDSEGACTYFIALVEAQNRGALDIDTCIPLPLELDPRRHEFKRDSAVTSIPSSRTSSYGFVSSHNVDETENEVAAWLDVLDPNLPIASCTPGFTSFGPIMAGTGLRQMIDGEADSFIGWLQKCYNILVNYDEHDTNDDEYDVRPFIVQLQTIVGSDLRLRVECTPDFQGDLNNTSLLEDPNCFLLRVVFRRAKYYLRKRNRHKKRPFGRRSYLQATHNNSRITL